MPGRPDKSVGPQLFAGRRLARFMRYVQSTSDAVVEPPDARDVILQNHPFIFAMWHGQFMMLPTLHTGEVPVSAIVARHGDAEIVGEALSAFNIDLVRGAGAGSRSRDRGGAQALRTALRLLKGGTTFAMTADVPPGPARRAGIGIVTIARMSGRPVIPFAAATSRYMSLKTWSRMTINLPYSKLAYVVGEPIHVPSDLDEDGMEHYRRLIEKGLNTATARAYELAGADPRRATPPSARLSGTHEPLGLRLKAYRTGTSLARGLSTAILKARERRGKEDPRRRAERMGTASLARPEGRLVWVHAASVGETNAVLPLIERLLALSPEVNILVTTGTVTSAGLAAQRLPQRAVHQYVPLDVPEYAQSFLGHWKPDLAVFTESEIWPNLILETSARKIPLAIVNARMSKRSFKRWKRSGRLGRALFSRFDLVLTQTERLQRSFRELGSPAVVHAGNLKIDAPPPPVDVTLFERLKSALHGRPVFVAASTHDGEETIIAEAHRAAARQVPGLLTIVAPRHPERGPTLAEAMKAKGFRIAQRSMGELPDEATEIYIADTIGELGTLYALAPLAFIGGSLVDRGGQNPIEAVGHGAAVLTGPSWRNFRESYRTLIRHNGAIEVRSAGELSEAVVGLIGNEAELDRMRTGAAYALSSLSGALDRTVTALAPFLALPPGEGIRRAS